MMIDFIAAEISKLSLPLIICTVHFTKVFENDKNFCWNISITLSRFIVSFFLWLLMATIFDLKVLESTTNFFFFDDEGRRENLSAYSFSAFILCCLEVLFRLLGNFLSSFPPRVHCTFISLLCSIVCEMNGINDESYERKEEKFSSRRKILS